MTGDELRTFLADSMALWRIDATVLASGNDAAIVTLPTGTSFLVRRSIAEDDPMLWAIERPAGAPRPCPSLVVMLSVLRGMLGGDATGPRLRIAPASGP